MGQTAALSANCHNIPGLAFKRQGRGGYKQKATVKKPDHKFFNFPEMDQRLETSLPTSKKEDLAYAGTISPLIATTRIKGTGQMSSATNQERYKEEAEAIF
ncbi:hypothetical protein MLD38_020760 [Melastoma candidum]|uniref:Uncharacterized protein n=1 Tax=Melastoma candidum TaxID=119954 RepID=A0ACB9QF75_9MYRT|nr:hypothetical protein MLD38_020760 [Melastoma candidum]